MKSAQRSIQQKIIRAILLTSAAVLLMTFASFLIYEYFSYRQVTQRQVRGLAQVIARNVTAPLAFDSREDAQEILSALRVDEHVAVATIYDKSGALFAVHPPAVKDAPAVAPISSGAVFEGAYLHVAEPIRQSDMLLGTLYIKRSTDEMYTRFIQYGFIGIFILVLAFALGYFLSQRLQEGISIPIISLAVMARSVSQHHDYSVRARKMSDDELGVLTEAFNKMLGQIELQSREIHDAQLKLQEYAASLEKKVEERTLAYKKQRDLVEAVFEVSVDTIGVYDHETRFITINKSYEDQFNIKREDVAGKKLLEVFPQALKGHEQLLRALAGETIHNPVYPSVMIDKYYESFLLPMTNDRGKVYAVVVIAHDITASVRYSDELRETAEQLRLANEALIQKNNELEQFAYVASHDLQEPLRKIQTFTGLAKKSYGNTESLERYLQKVETSAMRMSMLIRDVLDYSRLSQAGTIEETVNLQEVLDNVLTDFELVIEQKQAVLERDAMPTLQGNKLQLHQLFSNLIGNALKFTRNAPRVQVRCTLLGEPIDDGRDNSSDTRWYKLSFIDNGIGFDQAYAEKIFTIFQRLNTREQFEGTGIGLALCKKIVENHGGRIEVSSVPDQGTTFFVYLPARP